MGNADKALERCKKTCEKSKKSIDKLHNLCYNNSVKGLCKIKAPDRKKVYMETITVGLIKGRHEMPCAEYIFEGDVNPLDFEAMRETIRTFLLERVGIGTSCDGPAPNVANRHSDIQVFLRLQAFVGLRKLVVYVTGLTACTAALVAECARTGVDLTLMHFDRDSGQYVQQHVWG